MTKDDGGFGGLYRDTHKRRERHEGNRGLVIIFGSEFGAIYIPSSSSHALSVRGSGPERWMRGVCAHSCTHIDDDGKKHV